MASLATLAELLPGPGEWTEDDFLLLSDRGRLVELSDGNVEVLPLPTHYHQLIVKRLFRALDSFVERLKMGEIQFAPLPVRLWPGKIREPDLVYMSVAHADRIGKYWGVPDLAVEVVSEGGEITDKQIKRDEYARAGISEYWIVDPVPKTLELLTLDEQTGLYNPGTIFTTADTLLSPSLPGFSLSLAALFATPSK